MIDKDRIEEGKLVEFFGILDDTLDIGVAILDKDLRYRYINAGMHRELDLKPGELSIGDPLEKCHNLMIEKGILDKQYFSDQNITPDDHRSRLKRGERAMQNLTRFKNGTIHKLVRKTTASGYTVSLSHDVTELIETEDLLEQALQIGNAGYWIYDFKTQDFKVSSSLRSQFNADMEQKVSERGLLEMVDEEDRPLFDQGMKALDQTNGRLEVTSRSTHPEKGVLWFRTTGQAIRGMDGKWSKMQAFVKNITKERRQAQELEKAKDEAIAASVAKSEFLANMSHEIRTPMNGVLGMAELLADTDVNEKQREFIKVITRSSTALLRIINDILDFSKIEAGAFELDPVSFNLQDALDDVMAIISPAAHEKGLELIVHYPATMDCDFIGDVGRLRQVITNLISNAVKFTESGHVILEVQVSENSDPNMRNLKIAIMDTGIGIEDSKIEAVFEKFSQADGSTTRIYGGTGLGLPISRHIAELMGGTLKVESVLGEGSTFTMDIPIQSDATVERPVLDDRALSGKRVLVIDDIALNREILEARLGGWNMTVVSAADGVEGLVHLKNSVANGEPFDLIITDYLMPGINGRELASVIANNPAICGVPTVMLSSADQPVSSAELAEIGIGHYLLKPVREAMLHTTLVKALSPAHITGAEPDAVIEQNTKPDPVTEIMTLLEPETITAEPAQVPLSATAEPAQQPVVTPPATSQTPEPQPQRVQKTPIDQNAVRLEFAAPNPEPNHAKPRRHMGDMTEISVSQSVMASTVKDSKNPADVTSECVEILVAEDFQLNQDVVSLMLQDTVYSPVFAANGKIAVETFRAHPGRFKAVLMDISMPVMDGYEAAELIHNFEKLDESGPTPIIALTGHALKHDKDKCLDASMNDYLTKPVKQTDLLAALNKWCDQRDPNTIAPALTA